MMVTTTRKQLLPFVDGILNSYSQVFFSKNKIFSGILVVVTFFDWLSGLSGLLAVMIANVAARLIGFNRFGISQGYYGFNALLVGLGIGIFYQPGLAFFVLLFFATLFTLFITIWLENYFGKYGLPYLAWPFLLAIWTVSLAARQFTELQISERGLYVFNEMYDYGGPLLVDVYHYINNLPIHPALLMYFQSLGAIFFQHHLLAGILIAIGLIIYSRIAFLLSVVGFFSAYFYYLFIGANLGELSYFYIGFNYILTAIAIGGFFIIPSRWSFLWVLLLTPITSIIITSTATLFYNLHLSIFSLAFNIVVVLFIYVMKFRQHHFSKPELVVVQQYSPEKNLYTQHNYSSRFDVAAQQTPIVLPFYGEWTVTQGHQGALTHRQEWRHAWDFEITDENGKIFSGAGTRPEDYYAFNQSVIAPADGVVQEIMDGIDDNAIGKVNLEQNWGNTIIIRHADKLYSKISHLRKGSFVVKKGDEIKRGALLAKVGNSGRSPMPHIHFQLQENPYIGSHTRDYPIAKYIVKTGDAHQLKTFARPQKGETVTGITRNASLFDAFNFVPGQTISFDYSLNEQPDTSVSWEVKSDLYNQTYLECSQSGAKAWFKNDGTLFYFTHFSGDDTSLLYYFYMGAYKVALGYYDHLQLSDKFPLAVFKHSFVRFWQDFVAPFYIFMHADFEMSYIDFKDDLSGSRIRMASEARLHFGGKPGRRMNFEIIVNHNRIEKFVMRSPKLTLCATETES